MLIPLLSMTIDTIHVVYWIVKNGIKIPYHAYCYFMGYNDVLNMEKSELIELKETIDKKNQLLLELMKKADKNEKMLIELTNKLYEDEKIIIDSTKL